MNGLNVPGTDLFAKRFNDAGFAVLRRHLLEPSHADHPVLVATDSGLS